MQLYLWLRSSSFSSNLFVSFGLKKKKGGKKQNTKDLTQQSLNRLTVHPCSLKQAVRLLVPFFIFKTLQLLPVGFSETMRYSFVWSSNPVPFLPLSPLSPYCRREECTSAETSLAVLNP